MGDAADDAFDTALERWTEFQVMLDNIRDWCRHGKRCDIVSTPYPDDDTDWVPYTCKTCGEQFDV